MIKNLFKNIKNIFTCFTNFSEDYFCNKVTFKFNLIKMYSLEKEKRSNLGQNHMPHKNQLHLGNVLRYARLETSRSNRLSQSTARQNSHAMQMSNET